MYEKLMAIQREVRGVDRSGAMKGLAVPPFLPGQVARGEIAVQLHRAPEQHGRQHQRQADDQPQGAPAERRCRGRHG